MQIERHDYERLLEGLDESREHLRVMQVSGEQQVVDLARAFYRIDAAAAALRDLLSRSGQNQVRDRQVGSTAGAGTVND